MAVLHRPGLFNAPTSRRICTLERVEEAGSSFSFRCRHDTDIDKVLIYEAQANRMVTGPRGAQRVGLSLLARDPAGDALRALHESRRDIAYGDGGWILAHLVIKVVLRSDRARPPTIAVKIKPAETISFPRYRHERLIMELLKVNGILCSRESRRISAAAD